MKSAFSGSYAGRRVLVTGHTGFKGSWLCLWLQQLGAKVSGLALPASTTPSHWAELRLDLASQDLVDLRDPDATHAVVAACRPEVVFHLAAQPLVRRSYRDPMQTFATNVMGLVNLHEAIRTCDSVMALVNVTTDKVYRDDAAVSKGYREDAPLGGHDPYSTSKACAELVTECYRKSFHEPALGLGVRCATARAGNVIGGGDWSEDRLVPDFVRAAVAGQPLGIRNPDAIRPWQHVLEPLSAYLLLGQALLEGKDVCAAWNFGPAPGAILTVIELAERMRSRWPGVSILPSPGPHPHEAQELRLDSGKAARELGWRPVWGADTTIDRTIDWYRTFHESGTTRSIDDLRTYVADARAAGLGWSE